MADDAARSRLGRGLAALIGDVGEESGGAERGRGQRRAPIELLHAESAQSAARFLRHRARRAGGVDSRARHHSADRGAHVRGVADAFEIIAGERRWRAAQRAGLHDVPIVLLDVNDARGARARHHRERPAHRSQSARRGDRLSGARQRIRSQPGRHRPDRRQKPQPHRQHAAPAEALGSGEALSSKPVSLPPGMRGHCWASPIPTRWRGRSSSRDSTCARSKRWRRSRPQTSRQEAREPRQRAQQGRRHRRAWRSGCPMRSASRSASTTAATAACCRSAIATSTSSMTSCAGWSRAGLDIRARIRLRG